MLDNYQPRACLVELCVGLFALNLPVPALLAIHDAQCQASGVSPGTQQFVAARSVFACVVRGSGFAQAHALRTARKTMAQVVPDLAGAPMNTLNVAARVLLAKIERDLDKRMCSVCRTAPDDDDIQMCQGCLDVRFCNAACQKKAWKQHKYICKIIKSLAVDCNNTIPN